MALFPVIMCGGAGTRLWPASRPSRPKQFLALTGKRSLFQETVARVAPLVGEGGQLVIVDGLAHRHWIVEQLAELGVRAQVLLEPEGRDSAPAMAAAAVWVSELDPEGIVAFLASDHHIPDHPAFREALEEAARGTGTGRIVTLGVRPTDPSPAYGYIKPTGPGLSDVAAFVEKPDTATARDYIRDGYLWNSGNFIVAARTLLDELRTFAPEIETAVRAALDATNTAGVQTLSDGFRQAPRISIDYAVMEKTRRAAVLEVDFAWSDLGAWDAIAVASQDDDSPHISVESSDCLIRAPAGTLVATLGVRNLAIIAEADAILVCDLDRGQEVKSVVEQIRARAPEHLDFPAAVPGNLSDVLHQWMIDERLTRLDACFLRDDGLSRSLVSGNGESLDDTARLYDQAFVLLALATARRAGVNAVAAEAAAIRLREALLGQALPNGGFREAGDHPFQANAHMHLLEACLAWEEAGGDAGWTTLADRLVALAFTAFIDPEGGFLREFFRADWTPAEGEDGTLVEPGHQFEWAWLLTRYGRSRGDERVLAAATGLYAAGRRGIAGHPRIAIDALNTDGTIRSRQARLWPQTEWLKAALILAETASPNDRSGLLTDAASALDALWLYLTPDGLWHDKRLPDGGFVGEPAPASSFYHIMAGFQQLAASWSTVVDDDKARMTLA